jgi:hypothetical protein
MLPNYKITVRRLFFLLFYSLIKELAKLQKECEHKQQLIEKYTKKLTEWEVRVRALLENSSTLLDIPNNNQMTVSNDSKHDDNNDNKL